MGPRGRDAGHAARDEQALEVPMSKHFSPTSEGKSLTPHSHTLQPASGIISHSMNRACLLAQISQAY